MGDPRLRPVREGAGRGAAVWSSYTIGAESFSPPDATTNVHGEVAIDLREVRQLRPIEPASVEPARLAFP